MEENHMRNLLVAQSGGPTAAINATVAGVVSCAVLSGKVDHIYGAVNGIEGVLAEKFLDLGKKLDSAEKISLLMQTPAAALVVINWAIRKKTRRILKKYFKFFADMRSVILFISAEMIRWIP